MLLSLEALVMLLHASKRHSLLHSFTFNGALHWLADSWALFCLRKTIFTAFGYHYFKLRNDFVRPIINVHLLLLFVFSGCDVFRKLTIIFFYSASFSEVNLCHSLISSVIVNYNESNLLNGLYISTYCDLSLPC